ncbi:hypothetical protein CVT25_004127 [Psilocybe cyanescens]|uniref:Hydrophobin n=1 Tax=Psilocybe cyanescens TaxID=93625 RepID=A0A409XKU8_PSICY|nr:hypothetical protein CVT25_004127 [Psilocybe cyanescens]
MFSRVYSVIAFFLFFASLAAATATTTVTVTTYLPGQTPTTPASQCNTDSLFCCNFAQQSNVLGGVIAFLLGFAQIAVSPVTALIGADCTSIVGGDSCSAQPVCCQNNQFAGAIVIGCTPSNVVGGVIAFLLGIVQVAVSPVTALVGADCTSIVGGDSCSAQPVCCQNNQFAGAIVIGCTPVNLNL